MHTSPAALPSNRNAYDELFVLMYHELRDLARQRMSGERCGHTLQPTALVHEVFLKLKRQNRFGWRNDTHFLCQASLAMRQVLIDCARKGRAQKRQTAATGWTLTGLVPSTELAPEDYLSLDTALERLAARQPNGRRQARLVQFLWLAGMSVTEAARTLGISRRQAHRDWAYARVWLERELRSP